MGTAAYSGTAAALCCQRGMTTTYGVLRGQYKLVPGASDGLPRNAASLRQDSMRIRFSNAPAFAALTYDLNNIPANHAVTRHQRTPTRQRVATLYTNNVSDANNGFAALSAKQYSAPAVCQQHEHLTQRL